jgi:hypothetical protein
MVSFKDQPLQVWEKALDAYRLRGWVGLRASLQTGEEEEERNPVPAANRTLVFSFYPDYF